ncbi:Crinkler (CRN) family protein, partial [Thraustotheca clavata]
CHFADLVETELCDFTLQKQFLRSTTDSFKWEAKASFPSIKDDILFYLAILGGESFATYYDHDDRLTHLTKYILNQFPINQNTNTVSNDGEMYENMVAHAIFSSSRRNGVRGISFDKFFSCLLGEFAGFAWYESIRLTLDGKDVFWKAKIPFLAPINAFWPDYILIMNQNPNNCYFGNFCRADNVDRCDVYIKVPNKSQRQHHNMIFEEKMSSPSIFLAECKCWKDDLDMDSVNKIIAGVDKTWGYKAQADGKEVAYRLW